MIQSAEVARPLLGDVPTLSGLSAGTEPLDLKAWASLLLELRTISECSKTLKLCVVQLPETDEDLCWYKSGFILTFYEFFSLLLTGDRKEGPTHAL